MNTPPRLDSWPLDDLLDPLSPESTPVVPVFGKSSPADHRRQPPITACTHLPTTSLTDFQHASLSAPFFKSSVCRGWVMQVEFAGEAGRSKNNQLPTGWHFPARGILGKDVYPRPRNILTRGRRQIIISPGISLCVVIICASSATTHPPATGPPLALSGSYPPSPRDGICGDQNEGGKSRGTS